MTVVHVTNDVGEASGVGTFVRRVNDELVKLGVDSRIVKSLGGLKGLGTRESNNLKSKNQIILHIHGLWLGLHHAAAVWARKNGAKIVWSTHGMIAPWSMKHKRWKKLLAWWLYQRADLKRASCIHVTSALEAQWVRDLGFTQPLLEAPLGTDLLEEKVKDEGQGQERNCKTLLFVGRIYPVKALDRLIKAFALAIKQNVGGESRWTKDGSASDWVLRMVGPDQAGHMAELMSLCDRLNLPFATPEEGQRSEVRGQTKVANFDSSRPLVEFVGPKFGAELDAEYASCDALALVSHTENFGATVVDAMAHGKPVVTSTNTPWSVVQGKSNNPTIKQSNNSPCGWWCDNEPTALAKVLGEMMAMSDEERAEMGRRGRKLVEEKYTWGAVGKVMMEGYGGI